jgi:hypothetical protein
MSSSTTAPIHNNSDIGPAGVIEENRSLSRFEARLLLETAVEARFPRLIQRKPLYGGVPVGACNGEGLGEGKQGIKTCWKQEILPYHRLLLVEKWLSPRDF